jgi:hypothetical protein
MASLDRKRIFGMMDDAAECEALRLLAMTRRHFQDKVTELEEKLLEAEAEARGGKSAQDGQSRGPDEEKKGGDEEDDDDEEEQEQGGDDGLDVEAMGMEVEAKRRMLGLVEATEQQLADQGGKGRTRSGMVFSRPGGPAPR